MEIKKCPHCGGSAQINYNYSYKKGNFFIFVRCDICGAQGKAYTTKEDPAEGDFKTDACIDALNAWNMRTAERTK